MMPLRILTALSVVAALLTAAGNSHAQNSSARDDARIDRLLRGLTASTFEVRRDTTTNASADNHNMFLHDFQE